MSAIVQFSARLFFALVASVGSAMAADAPGSQDLPFLPMFQYKNVFGRSARIKGFEANSNTRTESWHAASWYLADGRHRPDAEKDLNTSRKKED